LTFNISYGLITLWEIGPTIEDQMMVRYAIESDGYYWTKSGVWSKHSVIAKTFKTSKDARQFAIDYVVDDCTPFCVVKLDRECKGHESTNGPIGNVVYCDGSCRN
jgi:hypothetical protein